MQLDDDTEVKCDKSVQDLLQSHTVRTKLANVIEKPAKGIDNAVVKFLTATAPESLYCLKMKILSYLRPLLKDIRKYRGDDRVGELGVCSN